MKLDPDALGEAPERLTEARLWKGKPVFRAKQKAKPKAKAKARKR
jgi:hypothetical protein